MWLPCLRFKGKGLSLCEPQTLTIMEDLGECRLSPRAGTTLGKETNKRSVLQGVSTTGQGEVLRSLAGAGKAGRPPGPGAAGRDVAFQGGAGPAEETILPSLSSTPNQRARDRREASIWGPEQARRVEAGCGGVHSSSPQSIAPLPLTWTPARGFSSAPAQAPYEGDNSTCHSCPL